MENVPAEYSHDTLAELHEAMGLDASVLLSSEFSETGGSLQEQSVTMCYSSEEDAAAAAELLDGQPVATGSGVTLHLSATVVSEAPPKKLPRAPSAAPSTAPSSAPSRVPPHARPGALPRAQDAPLRAPAAPYGSSRGSLAGAGPAAVSVQTSKAPPAAPPRPLAAAQGDSVRGASVEGGGFDAMDSIYPSVRVSAVPVEYTEEVIAELHESSGLAADTLMEIVVLEPEDPSSGTRCVVLRYADEVSAEEAVQVLQGRAVRSRSGRPNILQAELVDASGAAADGLVPGGGASGELEEELAEGEPQAQADCCSEGARCMGKAGELIYEDTWTGDAICEACWAMYYPHANAGS